MVLVCNKILKGGMKYLTLFKKIPKTQKNYNINKINLVLIKLFFVEFLR